jgi:hypothetical protein
MTGLQVISQMIKPHTMYASCCIGRRSSTAAGGKGGTYWLQHWMLAQWIAETVSCCAACMHYKQTVIVPKLSYWIAATTR